MSPSRRNAHELAHVPHPDAPSSEFDTTSSCLEWNSQHATLFAWLWRVSTSHAFALDILHSFPWQSSAPDASSSSVGRNAVQFTPRSAPPKRT